MSNELRLEHDPGVQVYAEIWDSVGQILTPAGLTFGAPVKAAWPAYDVPLPETEEGSGVYLADFPALPAGRYEVSYRERAELGADAAVTDDRLGGEEFHWDGSARLGLASLEAAVAAGGLTAEEVWTHRSRTLTQSAAQVQAVLTGSRLVIRRGDTWSQSLTGVGALTGFSKLWVTVKNSPDEDDDAAIAQWLLSDPPAAGDGLQYLNGAAATPEDGSVVVTDLDAGDLTVSLAAAAAQELAQKTGLYYDVQIRVGTVVITRSEGRADVVPDITRATS